jgi:hypothetical protein
MTRLASEDRLVQPTYGSSLPTLVRGPYNPVTTGSLTPNGTIYWWSVINAGHVLGDDAIDTYYAYSSTNHGSSYPPGVEYTRLYTAPHPLGPWTVQGDGTLGTGSSIGVAFETPQIVYVPEDPNDRPFYLYVHGNPGGVGDQATRLFSSADGQTGWTQETSLRMMHNTSGSFPGLLDPPNLTEFEGDGHTGYFRPFRVGGRWFAISLFGGTDFFGGAVWHSQDGKLWHMDPRIRRYNTHLTGDPTVGWGAGHGFAWDGRLWQIAGMATFASGLGVPVAEQHMSVQAPDMRVADKPVQMFTRTHSDETTGMLFTTVFVDVNGAAYCYVQYDENIIAYSIERA